MKTKYIQAGLIYDEHCQELLYVIPKSLCAQYHAELTLINEAYDAIGLKRMDEKFMKNDYAEGFLKRKRDLVSTAHTAFIKRWSKYKVKQPVIYMKIKS